MKEMDEQQIERNANKEQYMQGLGVTEGTVAQVTKEAMLENLRQDVEAYTKAVDNAKKNLDNYTEQLEVDKVHWDLLSKPGALRKITPIYVFEQDPLYWEIVEKKQAYKIREERSTAEGYTKQLQEVLRQSEEALVRAKEKLTRFEAE